VLKVFQTLVIGLVLLLSGCTGFRCKFLGCDKERPEFVGRSMAAVEQDLGKPTSVSDIDMRQCCQELDIELLNILPRTDTVNVRRLEWRYHWHTLYLWMQEKDSGWTVIDSAQYSNDVQF
jgi:hypothetical protein